MLMLITYDVDTTNSAGRRRLRQVAKICVNYGQRVQNSVFECDADAAEMKLIQSKLLKVIDTGKDSLRFYNLGNNYSRRIEHFGVKPGYDPEDTLIV